MERLARAGGASESQSPRWLRFPMRNAILGHCWTGNLIGSPGPAPGSCFRIASHRAAQCRRLVRTLRHFNLAAAASSDQRPSDPDGHYNHHRRHFAIGRTASGQRLPLVPDRFWIYQRQCRRADHRYSGSGYPISKHFRLSWIASRGHQFAAQHVGLFQ